MKNWKLPTIFKTPLGVVFALGLLIMLVEFLITSMILDPLVAKHLSGVYQNLVDAILLTLIISPVLYSLVFKRIKSDEHLRQINESVQEAIVIVNERGLITEWNPAAQRKFQYSQEEAIGQPLHQLLAPSHYHADAAHGFADFQNTGKGQRIGIINELMAIRKDGSEFPIELSVSAFKARDGWHAVGVMRDISKRKQTETALREREVEFHTLAEAMPQIVWITHPDGRNIYFNQQWMDYTGLTLEESLGHGWNKPFHPDDQQRAWVAWQQAVAGCGIYSIESRLRRADGFYRWWLVRGVPVKDAGGNILKWFGTCTDIHDLKMAELAISNTNAELRESERRFSDMLGNVELVSIMLDREARITYCNDYLLRLTGWKHDEIIGNNWFEFFSPPERKDLDGSFFETLLTNQPEARHHENEILTRAGGRLLIHWNNSMLRSASGEVSGIASIGEEITERKQLARLLAEKKTRLRTLVNTIPDLIWLKDAEGIYQSCNPMFERFFGAREGDIVGKSDFDFVDKELATSFRENDRIAMAADKPSVNEEWVVFADDGHRALLETVKAPMRDAWGKLLGVLGIARDITVRKQLEQDKEQYFKFFVLSINPMCIADPYGCFLQVNPAFAKLSGYSESELVAKPFLDFVLPEDRQRTTDEMHQQVEIRPTLHFENRYLGKDGSVIDLSWTAYYDKHDGITYATAIDVTERKRTEESLRKLSLAVEQSPSSIIITDLDSNIEYVNAAFVKATGYSATEAIGQSPRILSSGSTAKEVYEDMWAHLSCGEVWKGELINRRKGGGEYIESAWISPVRQPGGDITHYLSINEDITPYKRAQEALHASRENLHRLLNSMAEGVYGVDANGDCTFVNRTFLQMLGYRDDAEVLGKHIHEFIHHSHADGRPYPAEECRAYCSYRQEQAINVADEVFWRKDGVAVQVEYWSHHIVTDGVTVGAIVTFIDITERKRAETVLREKEILLSESQRIAHIGSWRYELTGQLTWSEETYSIYGVTPDTFTPNVESLLRLIRPADQLSMQAWISSCVAGQNPGELEYRIYPPDGSERVISGFGELQYDTLGRPNHLIGIVHDITERKLAEAKLADQLDELRRWHEVTAGREDRILDLKHEVNELLGQTGKHPRYPSAESDNPTEK
ncbi:MAG: PAS domain S-box protein [Sideroxyarcus sp.]|nr:PAS domain S-box protein [Sideroxyarcus sp.]